MWYLKVLGVGAVATVIAFAGSVWYAYNNGKQSGMSQIQTQWDAERRLIAEAQAEEMMKARQREEALKVLLERQRKEHQREVNRIVSRYNADLERLRDRPEARAGDSGVPDSPNSGVGCTGAGLSRPDAEFSLWFAAEAARTQAALNACVTAYDEVRRQVNGSVD